MAEELRTIPIHFVPVLEQICACLGYPMPVYFVKDIVNCVALLIIQSPNSMSLPSLACDGDPALTIEGSCESAAKRMVLSLVESEKIMVYDVNLEARVAHEHTAQLYALKKDVFERIKNEIPPATGYDFDPVEGVEWATKTVRLSYSVMLEGIIYNLGIPVVPIEILRMEEGVYSASMYATVPSSKCTYRAIKGEKMPNPEAAKESLAYKAIQFLMSKYHFEVEDVNFHFLNATATTFVNERFKYLNIKEQVYGFPEERQPFVQFQQHGILSPRSIEVHALEFNNARITSRKRELGECSTAFSTADGDFGVAAKRNKQGP